jgi:hypothetical protein
MKVEDLYHGYGVWIHGTMVAWVSTQEKMLSELKHLKDIMPSAEQDINLTKPTNMRTNIGGVNNRYSQEKAEEKEEEEEKVEEDYDTGADVHGDFSGASDDTDLGNR